MPEPVSKLSSVMNNRGSAAPSALAVASYEENLANDPEWAMSEGSKFFAEKDAVHGALRKITKRLEELGIPYAVSGGMALFRHGYRRFTEDVDILVNRDGLKAIHRQLEGRGYVPPFVGSKNLRDTELGVNIDFIVAGGYPGDGKEKPIAFPEPSSVTVEHEGIKYLNMPALVDRFGHEQQGPGPRPCGRSGTHQGS